MNEIDLGAEKGNETGRNDNKYSTGTECKFGNVLSRNPRTSSHASRMPSPLIKSTPVFMSLGNN